MTTYGSSVNFSELEANAVLAALEHYKQHCKKMVAEKAGPPFWAHLQSLDSASSKIHEGRFQTSGNSFDD